MAEEENFVSFVPYVIHMGNAMDDDDGLEMKPSLVQVPMIYDEVERRGPDEIIDLEEEEASKGPEEINGWPQRRNRRERGKDLEKGRNSNGKQLVSKNSCKYKVNFKPLIKNKAKKKQTDKKKTNKKKDEIVNSKGEGTSRKDGELTEMRRRVEQLLKDNKKLSKENQALRRELELNEDHLTRMTSDNKTLHAKLEKLEEEKRSMENIIKVERKRTKAIKELSSLSSEEVIKSFFFSFNPFKIWFIL